MFLCSGMQQRIWLDCGPAISVASARMKFIAWLAFSAWPSGISELARAAVKKRNPDTKIPTFVNAPRGLCLDTEDWHVIDI